MQNFHFMEDVYFIYIPTPIGIRIFAVYFGRRSEHVFEELRLESIVKLV